MSWPAGGGTWPVGASIPAAGGADMNMMMGQFTPEQWAVMQQQNWQQWTQWQQQYAQWQSQYGEKYAQMQAMAMGGGGGPAPPLPTQPSQPAPPPPEKPPPPPHENNQPLFQSAGAVKPVPPVSNAMLQHNQGNNQTQDNSRDPNSWNSSRPDRNSNADWNTSDKNCVGNSKDNWNNQNAWTQNSNQGDWNRNQKQSDYNNQNQHWNRDQNDWNSNNSHTWPSDGHESGKAGFDKTHQKPWGETGASHVNSEALKKHEEEERLFDIQFQKWEEEFDKWKQQNINHPDKKAYADYEQKFETCRAQLMERRQQMKLKKQKLLGNSVPHTPTKDIPPPPPPNKDPIQAPPQNYNNYVEPDKSSQFNQESSKFDQYNYTPSGNSNDSFNTNANFLSSSEQRKGIPGLDLVDEEDSTKIPPSNDETNVIDITDDPPAKTEQDFSAISKGIVNNILGDEKILNMLSIVKGQMQPNKASSGGSSANNFPNDMPGPNSGPMGWQNQNFQGQNRPNQNFLNHNRDDFNQQRGFNNAQMQPGGPRYGPMGKDMQQDRMGVMPPSRMSDMPPGRMGDMPPRRMGDMPPGRMGDMPPGRMGDMPPGRLGDMPPGRMGDIPPGRMSDMPPGRMGDMPPGRMGDMPPGRMSDMPPGRMGDMPPGRMADMPPGRMGDMPPGRMGDMPPGRMGDMPPGRMGDMPLGRMGDMPPGRMGDMPPGRMGDMPPRRMGDMPPGRVGDMPPGRMGDMPPGRMGDMPPGRMGDMPPGRMGDMPPGRMGDMPPGRMGDMLPGRMGDMPPGRMGDMPPGKMGDVQRGGNFPGPNYNSGPGRSDIARPAGQGSNYDNTGPQFRGRPDFPPHPDGIRRGNDFNQGPNFGGSPRPGRPDFGPHPDGMRHGDEFPSGPNSGPQLNLDRPEFPLRGENRGQDFQNSPMGRPNLGMNPNIRPQPNMGPQDQEIQRNLDMGIQRPDFMTQERGRGYGPGMQQDRMGLNMGMQGTKPFPPNQGGPQPLMGSKIDPPEGLIKGQGSMTQGPIESEDEPRKWIEETILEPSIIVDYEHKPLRMKVRDFIEPVQTFDYNHTSKDESRKTTKPGDRWSELDTYNQRSGTKVIDYKNKSMNDPPSDLARRRYDRESDRRDRFDDRRRDDRRDDRRRDERRDDRMRHDRYRGRDERLSPDNRSRERVDWNRRDRERDSHRPERSKEKARDKSVESIKSAKPEKNETPPLSAVNPVVMIDDLLDPPGRDVRPEKIVIILRGIPGSGKSYLAKLIKDREVQNGGSAPRILSIDDYFIQEVEVEEKDPATGKMVKKSTNQYIYDERQEENYLNSLKRAYRRTIADHFFPFIIIDACNEQVKSFAELWNFGRQNGFQVYLCTLECDVQTAFKRNIHNRTLEDLQVIAARFSAAPKNYVTIDATTLLQSAAIQEVHMEDVNSDDDVIMEDAMQDPEQEPLDHFTSKWERMEDADRLARLDGTSKPLRPSQFSLDEYLQLDDWQPQRTAQPGKKTVRWADIEERRQQEKMRAIGFVVGQTDWNRMTDPTLGSSALTQTKYIERARRPYK